VQGGATEDRLPASATLQHSHSSYLVGWGSDGTGRKMDYAGDTSISAAMMCRRIIMKMGDTDYFGKDDSGVEDKDEEEEEEDYDDDDHDD